MSNNNDTTQHGIDDNASDDAKKGLELGALGGGAVGAATGAAGGPIGAAFGGFISGSVGSLVSGAAVRTVDEADNDDTMPGIGEAPMSPGNIFDDTAARTGVDDTSAFPSTPDVYLDTTKPPLGPETSGNYEPAFSASGNDTSHTNTTEANQSDPTIVTGEASASNAGATSSGTSDLGLPGAIVAGPGGAVAGNDLGDGNSSNATGTTAVAGEGTKDRNV